MPKDEIYLGDGAYVELIGSSLRIYTSNGIETTNEVWLERREWHALVNFVDGLKMEGKF